MLTALGLSPGHEAVYTDLVSSGSARAHTIADRIDDTVESVRTVLGELAALGLVVPSATRQGTWVAAPPGVALQGLLNDRRHDLARAEATTARLVDSYRPDSDVDHGAHVEVVRGAQAVGHRFHQLQLGAREEVLALVTHQPVAVTGQDNDAEEVAVERGVRYRVVIERETLSSTFAGDELTASLLRDEEVRVVDIVPGKLLVADRSIALVSGGVDANEPLALVVHSPGIVTQLVALFEFVWSSAWPLRMTDAWVEVDPSSIELDDFDRSLLALLLSGASDAQAAGQLDAGLRTVQRRVRHLMDRAGAQTRIQLGWAARERGWINRT